MFEIIVFYVHEPVNVPFYVISNSWKIHAHAGGVSINLTLNIDKLHSIDNKTLNNDQIRSLLIILTKIPPNLKSIYFDETFIITNG